MLQEVYKISIKRHEEYYSAGICLLIVNNNGLVVKVLDYQSRGPVFKTTGWLLDSAFHPSEVDKMSTRKFWELNGKK